MRKNIHWFFTCYLMLLASASDAQTKVEMADVMRENGKIYVVVAVCLMILIGLFVYVYSLDRKITSIEKNKS
jgi:hypothetical protein